MKLISIIVAVYNTENYLGRCLDSILSQTYSNIECIVVDDGSTDGSAPICDVYAQRDNRVRVIHKKHEGLSLARNTAMHMSKGELIGFVDSDDYIDAEMYEKLAQLMEETEADIAMCGYCACNEPLQAQNNTTELVDGREMTRRILTDVVGSQLWKFLFKKELWDGIESPAGRFAQDMMILHAVSHRARKVVITEDRLYHYYRIRVDNTSNTPKNYLKGCVDRALAFYGRYEFCLEHGYEDDIKETVLDHALLFTMFSFSEKGSGDRLISDIETLLAFLRRRFYIILRCRKITAQNKLKASLIVVSPAIYRGLYHAARSMHHRWNEIKPKRAAS
jgi:glycosyltransferase involved in cell wall biosynthesis